MPAKLAPKIQVPGRGPGRNVPNGVLIGRQPGLSGRGPMQVLDLRQLVSMGLAGGKATSSRLAQAGFSFYAGGLLAAGEDLGAGSWGHAVTFTNGLGSSVVSLAPATSMAVFDIYAITGGVPSVIGTITFSGGSTTGVVNFPSLVVLPPNTTLRLNAPSSADATLASVSGTVYGFAS